MKFLVNGLLNNGGNFVWFGCDFLEQVVQQGVVARGNSLSG